MRITVNGTSLFVDIDGAGWVPDGYSMREKPTLLLLHGGPGHDHSIFKPAYGQLTDLAQLVYIDQRGNGRSQGSDPATWNLDQWADDIAALCDVLGITKPIVLGWSFGGIVAMHYAARYPDHPGKLILQSTMARMDVDLIVDGFHAEAGQESAQAARAFLTEGSSETFANFGQLCAPAYSPAPGFPSDEDARTMMRMVLNQELTMRFLSEERFDLRPELGAIRCPTLVLAGSRDPITPLAMAREIIGALPSDARLEVFEDSGHFIADSEREPFFALLRSFIEKP